MSQENVEVVRKAVEAFNRRDVEGVVATATPDVEWEDSMFWSEAARTYRGREGLREWMLRVVELWESLHVELEEVTEAPNDRVFYGLYLTGRGKGSGVEPPGESFWSVVWFADGKVTRRKVFLTRDEALEAAGLEE
jgi:ketosteroid isomerase-like protein